MICSYHTDCPARGLFVSSARTLRDLTGTITEISQSSFLKRVIWRSEVSSRIHEAYVEIEHTLQIINVSAVPHDI